MSHMKITTGLAGRYRMRVTGPDGVVRRETPWFNNLITDNGLNRIGTGSIGTFCHVGSGSTAPTVADTALETFVAATSTLNDNVIGSVNEVSEKYAYSQWGFRFAAGAAAGNISEVAIAWSGVGGSVFSRALVRDELGDPMTLTILSDEVLDVIYELRLYPPLTDIPFTLTIGGVEYEGFARTSSFPDTNNWGLSMFRTHGTTYATPNFLAYSGTVGAISGTPSGFSGNGSLTWDTYANNSYERTGVASFALDSSNFAGGITAFRLFSYGSWAFQFSVTPGIPKDATKEFTIRVTTGWARKTL